MISAHEAFGQSREDQGEVSSGARDLARELDLDHAPEPGGLQQIGTCRRCGMVAQDKDAMWVHQPSVGEIDAGEEWIDRNATVAADTNR